MQVKSIPANILTPAAELLRPFVQGLSPGVLVAALRSYDLEIKKGPSPRAPALSLRQFGQLCGVSEFTIKREIKRGKLQAFKVGGQWRVSDDEAQRYLGQAEG